MDCKEFVEKTVNGFNDESFLSIKEALLSEYLSFSFAKDDEITKLLLAEKICDYFEALDARTFKSFDKHLFEYMDDMASIVERRTARTPKQKKNAPLVEMPRARKYYLEADSIKDSRKYSVTKIIDYSRIIMCLYMAIINNNYKTIDDFDFSADCLDRDRIIKSMKGEKNSRLHRKDSKNKFDVADLYSRSTCTFIIALIMLQTIANERY